MFLLQGANTETSTQMSSTEQLFWTNLDIFRKVKGGDFSKERLCRGRFSRNFGKFLKTAFFSRSFLGKYLC